MKNTVDLFLFGLILVLCLGMYFIPVSLVQYILAGILGFFLINAIHFPREGKQEIPKPVQEYTLEDLAKNKSQWEQQFGKHKICDASVTDQFFAALHHYPEIHHGRFFVKRVKTDYAHSSRPIWYTLLLPFLTRKYLIAISNQLPPEREPTKFDNLSLNAQIGVLGHELSHSLDYFYKSNTEIMLTGIAYSFASFKKRLEVETDQSTVDHHLGFQLLSWSKEVNAIIKDGGYLSPEKIEALMRKNPAYLLKP